MPILSEFSEHRFVLIGHFALRQEFFFLNPHRVSKESAWTPLVIFALSRAPVQALASKRLITLIYQVKTRLHSKQRCCVLRRSVPVVVMPLVQQSLPGVCLLQLWYWDKCLVARRNWAVFYDVSLWLPRPLDSEHVCSISFALSTRKFGIRRWQTEMETKWAPFFVI
jgi:hypothetical protein